MLASYSEYLKKRALLDDPSKDITPDVRARVEAALAEYEQKNLQGDEPLSPEEGASAINQAAGLPSQEEVSARISHAPRQAEDLGNMVEPGFTSFAKALDAQPSTTHPGGDEAAKQEWVRGDIDNPNGRVIVYDAPLHKVREDLANNPAMFNAIAQSLSLPPGMPYTIDKGGPIEQMYQQMKWRETADAATKAGKTAYRHSQAPWLGDGKNGGLLNSLSLKVKSSVLPAIEQSMGFVLGVDDLGVFGMGKAGAGELLTDFGGESDVPRRQGAVGTPIGGGKDEVVGGVTQTAQEGGAGGREYFNALEEESPKAHLAGQVYAAIPGAVEAAGKLAAKGVGLASKAAGQRVASAAQGIGSLGEWLPSNQLWTYAMGEPAKSVAGKVIGGAAKNAIAGGASEGIDAAVDAASNYRETGDTGMTPGEFGSRVGMGAGMSGVLGTLGGLLHSAATGAANWVREGDYYRQLPGTVEALGSEPQFYKGFSTPPVVEAAREEARTRPGRPKPIHMIAEKTDKPLGDAAYHEEARTIERVKQQNEEVFNSPEGALPLPARELAGQAVTDLRAHTSRQRGVKGPTSVGIPNAERPARAVLNTNVDGISVHPVEGAIPMTPEEAQAWLHPKLQEKAVKAAKSRKAAPVTSDELATIEKDFEPELGSTALATTPAGRERKAGARGSPTPELPGNDTRFSPEGPDHRPGRAAPSPEAPSVAPTGAGPMVRGARPQGAREAAARETGPRGEGPPSETRYSTRAPEGGGSRWQRAGAGEGAGTTARELRKAGVNTVYVLPRKYDARRQEAVIHLLRTGGGNSEKARRLVKYYQAAKRDRLQRPWQGKEGGYSELQAQHEELLATAKDLRKRVAPKGSAYAATVRHGRPAADSKHIDAMQRAAEIAGGNQPELVRGARILQPLTELQGLSTFGRTTSSGGKRLPYGLSAFSDAAILRGVYPVARGIERTADTAGGRVLSRLALTGAHNLQADGEQKKAAPKVERKAPAKKKRKRYSRHNREREKP